ncbi:MAG: transmembrane anchor protein [Marinomonas sp.]|nr:MAG: transmembrane anchor protein [Marinomonas sp.]
MYNANMPSKADLPSTKQLLRSTLLALVAAVVILTTIVLPAEYAVDPTGVGRMLGLTDMGEIKQQLAAEAEQDAALTAASNQPLVTEVAPAAVDVTPAPAVVATAPESVPEPVEETWRDEIEVVLPPGQGTEYKLVMEQDAVAEFYWEGVEGPLNFDTHGDTKGQSISYEKGRNVRSDSGEIKAAFTGNHGWFFRNRTNQNVTLILKVNGDYQAFKKLI